MKSKYIFETAWEVCNKIGGIHTVLASKAPSIQPEYGDNYFFIGPDVWMETSNNPEFTEDKLLYPEWVLQAHSEGINFRIGHWNIKGKPIAILIDFKPYFSEKDKIFASWWESYKLDSISGGWDYIEPALFGYAVGRVIDSFQKHFGVYQDGIIAHFHEWMTGSAILYLKQKNPSVATVFTTHATVLGRSIAGNGLPLYDHIERYNPELVAREFSVVAKHSIEKLAAENADMFTTVSEVTNIECKHFLGKVVDVVTPNGFDGKFVTFGKENLEQQRVESRDLLLKVAGRMTDISFAKDTLLIGISGRYEYRNKGIDVFLEALNQLKTRLTKRRVIAFLMIPGGIKGPNLELAKALESEEMNFTSNRFTHQLTDKIHDPIRNKMNELHMYNAENDLLTVIGVPAYLNGQDGIFNTTYYDLLSAFDLSVFPSYYEPWGYTPLESVAFGVPSVTTNLSGFGRWVQANFEENKGLIVVPRGYSNDEEVISRISEVMESFYLADNNQIKNAKIDATRIAKEAQWKKFIKYYKETYELAIEKAQYRSKDILSQTQFNLVKSTSLSVSQKPSWKKVLVRPVVPKKLNKLAELTKNLWWSWNYCAQDFFEELGGDLWFKLEKNPVAMLEKISQARFERFLTNPEFMVDYENVLTKFETYMAKAKNKPKQQIAYFSMEYGIDDSLKIYSGGLGILAGDYLKQASDSNINMIGIGLLYRYGYFKQKLSLEGDQLDIYNPQKFSQLSVEPVRFPNGEWAVISIALPGRKMMAKIWVAQVGRIPLYLLDTDVEENSEEDRKVTHQLYGGDWENRLKQELLLGVGGIRLIEALGLKPDIYHANEGHAAFNSLERLKNLIQDEKLSFNEAKEVVRASTLFTTHTPVPAGHDAFEEGILRKYILHYADRLQLSWDEFMNLGRWNSNQAGEKFSMSVLAARMSQEMNGVSRIHGRVSQKMFASLYEGYYPDELHIGYVTNSVHYSTWASKAWQQFHHELFGEDFLKNQSDEDLWKKIDEVPNERICMIHFNQKKLLFDYLRIRLTEELTQRQENPAYIVQVVENMDPKALTIGFARRFATYKRAHLLFTNLDRLRKLVSNKTQPIQFLFAGKAHPHDKAGQDLIKRVIEVSKMPDFIGKVLFVENYDMQLAKYLVSGVDVWLNTPTRPLEASGTSGEKAVMNGVMNFSVLDGWWAEGYKDGAGWALEEGRTYLKQDMQNMRDVEIIYSKLESEILRTYYEKNTSKVSDKWVTHIKNTFTQIAPRFTMKRMLDDYFDRFYNKLFTSSKAFQADHFKLAVELAKWKEKTAIKWENISIVSVELPQTDQEQTLSLGDIFIARIEVNLAELLPEEVRVEILFGEIEDGDIKYIIYKEELKVESLPNGNILYSCAIAVERTGVYDYVFRLSPKSKNLAYQEDFPLIKWV
ncbi:MAG: alpha-glucan family phosphorylase [Bacteroidales bacterium]|nr:alpha-glucan family phosphorylase [Bacteroidales bacterium]